jgi:mono/diheme cytochrome c family protein
LYNGPDGALYVVDMYHGILQHRIYLTPYLRQQVEDRGLQEPIHLGRIYRIVPRTRGGKLPADLASANTVELVQQLTHHSGWVRDMAQRLLVERGDTNAIPLLKNLKTDTGRLHALWTLEGLGQFDRVYLKDPNPSIRAAAIRISGRPDLADRDALPQIQSTLLAKDREALRKIVEKSQFALARDAAKFSLGEYEVAARKPKAAPPMTAEERMLFNAGKAVYEMACVPCHQPHGMGQEGLAPPLAQSEWVSGSPERLVRIVLNGLRGPIKVKGQTYELDMPSLGVLSDEQIAAVLTYIRRDWNHGFAAVSPALVKKVREASATRVDAWTAADLQKAK